LHEHLEEKGLIAGVALVLGVHEQRCEYLEHIREVVAFQVFKPSVLTGHLPERNVLPIMEVLVVTEEVLEEVFCTDVQSEELNADW